MRTAPVPVKVTPRGAYLFDRSTYKPGGKTHLGVDLAAKRGTPVKAPEDGEVIAVWYGDDTPGWRRYGPGGVAVQGDSGVLHVLAHLLPSGLPSVGARVSVGEVVGAVSGLRHVHWEVRKQRSWGGGLTHRDVVLDPLKWLDALDEPRTPGDWLAPAVDVLRADAEPGSGSGVVLVALAVVAVVLFARR